MCKVKNSELRFSIGDIVKIDRSYFDGKLPYWYTSDSFEILSFMNNNFEEVEISKWLEFDVSYSNHVYVKFLMLDIIAMRKKKLERLGQC